MMEHGCERTASWPSSSPCSIAAESGNSSKAIPLSSGTNCGLRLKSGALTLRWADVDVMRRTLTVAAAYAKSRTSRTVSLNSLMLATLSRLLKHSEFVFAKPNRKPYHAVRGFRAACQRAGLTGVTPHSTQAYVYDASGGKRGGSADCSGARRMGHAFTDPALCARLPFSEGGSRRGTREKFHYAIHYAGVTTRWKTA